MDHFRCALQIAGYLRDQEVFLVIYIDDIINIILLVQHLLDVNDIFKFLVLSLTVLPYILA